MSKVAVVYWSGTGNTEMMAMRLQRELKLLELKFPYSHRIPSPQIKWMSLTQ